MAAIVMVRRLPVAGDVGCVGACPLCSVPGKASPPCLACREELRNRLADMNVHYYMQRAMN